ncbi:Ketosteroid isomerase [Burkholderiales bacterium 8X]|nr:Ketosteroid isomerase [Burkholderiales bacterium 8X]
MTKMTTMTTMTTMAIANKMIDLCRQGKNEESLDTLFSKDMVSVDAMAMEGGSKETSGLENVKKKSEWWVNNHEIHSATITGPWPNGDRFVVGFKYDVTFKPKQQRMTMDEVGLYTVEDGKIVREEFFYAI